MSGMLDVRWGLFFWVGMEGDLHGVGAVVFDELGADAHAVADAV